MTSVLQHLYKALPIPYSNILNTITAQNGDPCPILGCE